MAGSLKLYARRWYEEFSERVAGQKLDLGSADERGRVLVCQFDIITGGNMNDKLR